MSVRPVRRFAALAATLATLTAVVTPGSAAAAPQRDVVVTSFDGTPIVAHFFPADGLTKGKRAPVAMLAHGYGETGPKSRTETLAGMPSIDALLKSGYNVLTWDARGHGGSGGTAMLDSPDFEVRDTRKLIDWLAKQPEVKLDRAGDPRVGMAGASYGGIIQFNTAGVDKRVDVISPSYTGHSLSDMIAPHGKFKETWASFLVVATAQTVPPGVISPAGPQVHTPDPEAMNGLMSGTTTGALSENFRAYLHHRSPSRFVSKIRIPTLLQQGTTDLLFPPNHAVRHYRVLKANGVPVKMVWNCEGHSVCGDRAAGTPGRFTTTTIRWFDRWLKRDASVRTGGGFEWIADNETKHRSAYVYPPKSVGTLKATGAGSLALSPASPFSSTGFIFVGGSPATYAINADFAAPKSAATIAGPPKLTFTYSGLAMPGTAHVYAQIVDVDANRVVGGQVTPIPVTLDGAKHTVSQSLDAIATRASTSSNYRLQIMGGSLAFGQQRSVGNVQLHSLTATLPLSG